MPSLRLGCVWFFFLLAAIFNCGCTDHRETAEASVLPKTTPEVAIVPEVADEEKIHQATDDPEAQGAGSTTAIPETDPALRDYIRGKLAELDKFRSTPEFIRFGFGIGGPYNNWLKEVEFASHDPQLKRFGVEERIAVGDLLGLGMAYVSSQGEETKYTTFTRQAILDVIK